MTGWIDRHLFIGALLLGLGAGTPGLLAGDVLEDITDGIEDDAEDLVRTVRRGFGSTPAYPILIRKATKLEATADALEEVFDDRIAVDFGLRVSGEIALQAATLDALLRSQAYCAPGDRLARALQEIAEIQGGVIRLQQALGYPAPGCREPAIGRRLLPQPGFGIVAPTPGFELRFGPGQPIGPQPGFGPGAVPFGREAFEDQRELREEQLERIEELREDARERFEDRREEFEDRLEDLRGSRSPIGGPLGWTALFR